VKAPINLRVEAEPYPHLRDDEGCVLARDYRNDEKLDFILAATAAFGAAIEWRDARAAFLQCAEDVAHTEDDFIPQDISRRYNDAEAKLFEIAKRIPR